MKWRELFGKKAAEVPQQSLQAQAIVVNPNKREQATRAAARLARLFTQRDKYGGSEELEADIARHQKALRLAEFDVPEDARAATALAKKVGA